MVFAGGCCMEHHMTTAITRRRSHGKTRITMIIAIAILAAAAMLAAVFTTAGPDRFWRFFGDPDLGQVAFESLVRRTTPNDALACPPASCGVPVDLVSPVFEIPVNDLRAAFTAMMATEPRVTAVDSNDETLTDRYIQRSALLGFPDTIIVKFIELPDGASSLAMYSRSQFGRRDMGVNQARLERWLSALAPRARVH